MNKKITIYGKDFELTYEGQTVTYDGGFVVITRRDNPREISYTEGILFKRVKTFTQYDWTMVAMVRKDVVERVEISNE